MVPRARVAAALLVAAVLAGCRNRPVEAGSPATEAIQTADWQTFHNDKAGVELKYPRNWSAQSTTRGPGAFPFIALTPPGADLPGAQAGLTIALLTSDQAMRTCGTPTEHRRSIGGVEFFQSEFTGGGPHAAFFQRNHRAVHDGACYEIVVYGANVNADKPLASGDPASRFARIADAMIDSFQFIPRLRSGVPLLLDAGLR